MPEHFGERDIPCSIIKSMVDRVGCHNENLASTWHNDEKDWNEKGQIMGRKQRKKKIKREPLIKKSAIPTAFDVAQKAHREGLHDKATNRIFTTTWAIY
jgi:hypothetical protein